MILSTITNKLSKIKVSAHKNYLVYVPPALKFKIKHLTHRVHLFIDVIIV